MGPRDPHLSGVPYLRDLLKEGSAQQKTYDVINMNFEVGQAWYAPPGTPANVLAILRKAFTDMVADPATKADILKRTLEFSPKSWQEDVKLIEAGFKAATPEVIKVIKGIYIKKKAS